MSRATAIVLTTIFEPDFLDGFLGNLRRHGREESVTIYIIVDRKTPPSVADKALTACREGFRVVCPSLSDQETFLARLGVPEGFIPYNTDNRRNIGFLMALDDGCEVLVSIDDDNFCVDDEDFVGRHQVVGMVGSDPVVATESGWFNACSLLEGWEGEAIFPRGFPYAQQARPQTLTRLDASLKVAVNAGLWLGDPDVDAVYRLCRRPHVSRFRGNSVVLSPRTWSPINTQNTALMRDVALTYYYVRMGFALQGLKIDRFGDILSGYLTQKVVKHLGYGVRMGDPILDHRRTPHNLWKDLYHELAGLALLEDLLPWLVELKLTGTTPLEAYGALAEELIGAADTFSGFVWDDGGREFLRETGSLMQVWVSVVRRFS